jgi:hypothetical protein
MTHELESMENVLLDDLASLIETMAFVDVQIRESIDSRRRNEGQRLATTLVHLLEDKRIGCEAILQALIVLRDTHRNTASFRRCSDMSTHLLNLISIHLPVYQRISTRLIEGGGDESHRVDIR